MREAKGSSSPTPWAGSGAGPGAGAGAWPGPRGSRLAPAPRPAGPGGPARPPAGGLIALPLGPAGLLTWPPGRAAGAGILPEEAVAAVEVRRAAPGCEVAVLLVRPLGGGALALRAAPGGGEAPSRELGGVVFAAPVAEPHTGRGLGSAEVVPGRDGEEEVGSTLRELVVLAAPLGPGARPLPAPPGGVLSPAEPPGALEDMPLGLVAPAGLRGASSGLLVGPDPLASIATLGSPAAFFGFFASGSEVWLRPKGDEFPDP